MKLFCQITTLVVIIFLFTLTLVISFEDFADRTSI